MYKRHRFPPEIIQYALWFYLYACSKNFALKKLRLWCRTLKSHDLAVVKPHNVGVQ